MWAHRGSCKTRQPVLGLYWKAATESQWTASIMATYKQQSFLKRAVEKEKGDFKRAVTNGSCLQTVNSFISVHRLFK